MIPRLVPEIEGEYPERDGEEGAEGLVMTYFSKGMITMMMMVMMMMMVILPSL